MSGLVYENITRLETPVGFFCVSDENGLIPFSAEQNNYRPYEVTDEDENVIGCIDTDTRFALSLDVSKLQTGKEYVVRFIPNADCRWDYCFSDEDTTCYSTLIGKWAVGIGAYDINTQEKMEQERQYSIEQGSVEGDIVYLLRLPVYDETDFVGYIADVLDSFDGYRFKVIDSHFKKIYFDVAWIKVDEYPAIEYDKALGSWLC